MSQRSTTIKSQAGFTLVELAIVMIIIGLLIGGVLKGQQLISNAQVAATVAQLKSIDAATTSFKDAYAGLPGDLLNAPARLPNCLAGTVCGTAGDGNGRLPSGPGDAPTTESLRYFPQLGAAGLLTGINYSAAACGASWGTCFPDSKLGGGVEIGYTGGGALMTSQVGGPTVTGISGGMYLTITDTASAAMSTTAGNLPLTANLASRIDTKVDDGVPTTGIVFAGGAATCVIGAAAVSIYDEKSASKDCGVFVKIQN